MLRAAIHEVQPDIVLCVGQAGGRTELCLERVAINVQDARIKDNDGKQPIDRRSCATGPAAYLSTLPIKACVAEMRKAGLPAAVSNTRRHLRLQPRLLRRHGHGRAALDGLPRPCP